MESARAVADRRIKPIDLSLIVAGRCILLIRIFSRRNQTHFQKNQRLSIPGRKISCCTCCSLFSFNSGNFQSLPATTCDMDATSRKNLPPALGGLPGHDFTVDRRKKSAIL